MGQFYKALSLNDLPTGTMKQVNLKGIPLAIYNVADKIYATTDICSHKQCLLTDGIFAGTTVECPCHGGKFDVTTGAVKALPPTTPLKTYKTRINEQEIEVEI